MEAFLVSYSPVLHRGIQVQAMQCIVCGNDVWVVRLCWPTIALYMPNIALCFGVDGLSVLCAFLPTGGGLPADVHVSIRRGASGL